MNISQLKLWICPFLVLSWVEISLGKKCYACLYWNAAEVPQHIQEINHASCGKGNKPEKRFEQECKAGEICEQAHVEFLENLEIKSISSRSCVKQDEAIHEKCVTLKTLKDLYSLKETSRIVKYDRDGVVKEGVACGCTGNLCNTASNVFISKIVVVVLLLNILLYF